MPNQRAVAATNSRKDRNSQSKTRGSPSYYPTRPTKPLNPQIEYHLVRDEIDYLVIVLYQLSGMHPQGGLLKETGKSSLLDDNPCADRWDMRVAH